MWPSTGEKGFNSGKLARNISVELTGEYDIKRVWDGVDPSTEEKLSTWDRIFAGGIVVASITPVWKLAKVGKGVKMTTEAVEATKAVTSTKPNFVLFNKIHRDSMPKDRGPNSGDLQSHHGLQHQ